MPELPEVETTLRGIEPWLAGRTIRRIVIREPRLRWPVPAELIRLQDRPVTSLERRAKYILAHLGPVPDGAARDHGASTGPGALLLHLGMSGSMRVLPDWREPGKHDHFDIETDAAWLRFNDPRRFGSLLWAPAPALEHPLLLPLGPEPLSAAFDGRYLWRRSRGRRLAVKNFIMTGGVVVGVGNIYASEALFMAGIHPRRAAGRISAARYDGLALAIRDVLQRAIEEGGTSLRDFTGVGGTPGYFAHNLLVYGREGQPCFQCGAAIRQQVIGQRSSFYCLGCQT
jgi:formamidopyrimidine-DNA glycosylase